MPDAITLAGLSPQDSWVLARSLSGENLDGEAQGVSYLVRDLVQRITEAPVEERHSIWNAHLATLPTAEADIWIEAVAAVSPNDPPPEDDGWGPPRIAELPPVEPFPLDVYPPQVARLIRHTSRSIGCPNDFAGLAVLAVAGGAIGRSASLRLKNNYFVSASIYAACIGIPSDGKSPAIEKVVGPMQRIEEEHLAKWKEEKAEYDALIAKYEEATRVAKRSRPKSEKADDLDETSESEVSSVPPKPVAPVLRRGVVRDITIEAMDALMEQNDRGLLQVFDEASSMITSMNQYRGGKGSDRQWYMSTWSGQPRTVDRKGNSDYIPISVPHPYLCLIGGIVPDKVGTFCDEHGHHDGFIDRFLFAYPDPLPKMGWREDGIPDETLAEWSEIVNRLQALPMRTESLRNLPNVVQFAPDGKRAWSEMIDTHHAEQRSVEFPRSLSGPWGKLEQYAGRITLVLHMLDLAASPSWDSSTIPDVSANTVRKTGRLIAYLKSHTRRVYAAMKASVRGEEGDDDVRSILKWIFRHQPESFTLRDLTRDLSRTFSKRPVALEDALAWLEKHNCIRLQPQPDRPKRSPGRSRSRVYLVNPHLIGPQNCQNHHPDPQPAPPADHYRDSGDSAKESQEIPAKEDGDGLFPF